jgi:3-deoxy-D-manno-octulosonate 8-phosphate phosphatase (KDO 8-P phosphatase)
LTHAELVRRAGALEWLLCDVDGVLTDGRMIYGPEGESWKEFDVRDGLGMHFAREAGLKVGILSGRRNQALQKRAEELHVDVLIMDRPDKRTAFAEFLAEHQTEARRVAFIGDDLLDLPVLGHCGLSFAPADACADVLSRVDRVLTTRGGRGAVREMIEIILQARGAWSSIVQSYLPG